jgi:MinD-like ATPase involved in chromosome partitioning or flagellar assembly
MTVIAVHGCKQAPGVTTLTLALTAVLDGDGGAVLVEADAHGGDLSAVLGRPPTPGWVSLAAAGRHRGAVDLAVHLQALPAGGRALLAPAEPTQTEAALRSMSERVVDLAAGVGRHVVIDLGRSTEPIAAADAAILVCHPTVAGVEQARVRIDLLDTANAAVVVAISASGPYRPDEVSAVLGRPVLGPVPSDGRGVSALAGVRRNVHRTPLVRFAASMVEDLRSLAGSRELTW